MRAPPCRRRYSHSIQTTRQSNAALRTVKHVSRISYVLSSAFDIRLLRPFILGSESSVLIVYYHGLSSLAVQVLRHNRKHYLLGRAVHLRPCGHGTEPFPPSSPATSASSTLTLQPHFWALRVRRGRKTRSYMPVIFPASGAPTVITPFLSAHQCPNHNVFFLQLYQSLYKLVAEI